MSLRKKKPTKTLSDSIAELLLPQPLLDPEVDANDETAAKDRYFEEGDGDEEPQAVQKLSDIRKRNVKLLQDVDRKYSGKIASRKDFEEDEAESEANADSEDESEEDGSDDGVSDGGLENGEVDEENSSGDDDEEDEDEYENSSDDEEDVRKNAKVVDSEDEEGDDSEGANESGQDDSEVLDEEEADSDQADDDDDDEDAATDDDESDFDGGDFDLAPKKQAALPEDTVAESIKPSNLHAEISKGTSIQNQLNIWEKLLEVRIHSQKVLIKANSLPAFDQMQTHVQEDATFKAAVQTTESNVDKLLSKLTEMQSLLVAQYPETKELHPRKRKLDAPADEDDHASKVARHSDLLTDRHNAYREYRDTVLLKWYDRTKVLTPGTKEAKHSSAQHNILQNISGILANRSELVRKTQLHKGGYDIIGQSAVVANVAPIAVGAENDADQELPADQLYSAEIYDDTDFYHTQLRELIEFKANASSNPTEMNRQFVELQKLRKKMKKVVDTRASKGRKIRYVVHNKMVNFMARNDTTEWTDDGKTELYSSLFGARVV